MRDHRTTEELERISGPERTSHPARLVASAERELALRHGNEEDLFQRKLTRSGTIAAAIGAVCIFWPVVVLVGVGTLGGLPHTGDANQPLLFRYADRLFDGVAALQIACGCLLLAGGIATRRRRSWGPRLICISLGLAMAFLVVFTLGFVQAAFGFCFAPDVTVASVVFGAGFVIFALGNAALWAFLLWLPFRFFRSPRVKVACDRAVA